jgi:transposase
MESSGMWYNIYECLRKRQLNVRLSNPAKTRAIASASLPIQALGLATILLLSLS